MSKDSLSDWSTDQYGCINLLPQYTGSGEAIHKVINDLDRSNLISVIPCMVEFYIFDKSITQT